MLRQYLITLREPVIVSATAATLSAAPALAYIPGSALQGLVLSRTYDEGRSRDAIFRAFHSGGLIFEDALPVDADGILGFPVPMSLHHLKTEEDVKNDRINPAIRDFSVVSAEFGYRQCRGFAVSTDGRKIPVEMGATMRTAIAEGKGVTDKGRLYEYRFLKPGQRFAFRIEGAAEILDQIETDGLCGECLLGRVRSAEFGRVTISTSDVPWDVGADGGAGGTAWLWCLSDLWPKDETGLPTALPCAADLCRGQIDWTHSFVRYRRYSSYNAEWQARTPEREVIIRGSVLKVTDCGLASGLHRIGLGQDAGLGLVWVSRTPPKERVTGNDTLRIYLPVADASTEESPDTRDEAPPDTRLSHLLKSWATRRADRQRAPDTDELKAKYDLASMLAGRRVGPGVSQWTALQSAAASRDPKKLVHVIRPSQLKPESENKPDPDWGVRFAPMTGDDEIDGTFEGLIREQFPGLFNGAATDADFEALASLARAVGRAMRTEEGWLNENPRKTVGPND